MWERAEEYAALRGVPVALRIASSVAHELPCIYRILLSYLRSIR